MHHLFRMKFQGRFYESKSRYDSEKKNVKVNMFDAKLCQRIDGILSNKASNSIVRSYSYETAVQ